MGSKTDRRPEIKLFIITLISAVQCIDVNIIKEDSRLLEDLFIDEENKVIGMRNCLSNSFCIRIPRQTAKNWVTVKDVIDCVTRKTIKHIPENVK